MREYTELQNNRPVTHLSDGTILNTRFEELPQLLQEVALEWTREHLTPSHDRYKKILNAHYLKHLLEFATDVHLTRTQFEDMLLLEGWQPLDATAADWCYSVDRRCTCAKGKIPVRDEQLCARVAHWRAALDEQDKL